jgi:hypothetical protein
LTKKKRRGRRRKKKQQSINDSKKKPGVGKFDSITEQQAARYLNWYKEGGEAKRLSRLRRNNKEEETSKPAAGTTRIATMAPISKLHGQSILESKIPLEVSAMRALTTGQELELRHDLSALYETDRYTIQLSVPFAPALEEEKEAID